MPDVKCTWLFNGSSAGTTAKHWGFSETWYSGLEGDALIAAMDLVSDRRCQILADETAIVGYRIGQPNGRSYVIRKTFVPPQQNDRSNLPVDAALCQVGVAGRPNIKKFWLHDLPDDWIANSEIASERLGQIRSVVDSYPAFGFRVRFQDQSASTVNVLGVTSLGVLTTVQPIVLAPNSSIQFLNCRDENNRPIRGSYIVSTVTSTTQFTLAHWPGRTVGRSGKIRAVSMLFGASISLGARGVITGGSRKVGRPFFQSRGRAPVRR